METLIREILEEILNHLSTPFRKIRIEKRDEKTYRVNIESEEPSLLIGHHGENIGALQNVLKTIFWKKQEDQTNGRTTGKEAGFASEDNINVILDVDDYRKRQEENVIKLAQRKVEMVRKNQQSQPLPAMSPYFRRVVHLYLAENFNDIETESVGEGDFRHITIKLRTA